MGSQTHEEYEYLDLFVFIALGNISCGETKLFSTLSHPYDPPIHAT